MAMEILHCNGQAAFLRRQEGARSPNNNTPVLTGVLWFSIYGVGGDLASSPNADHDQEIEDVNFTILIVIA